MSVYIYMIPYGSNDIHKIDKMSAKEIQSKFNYIVYGDNAAVCLECLVEAINTDTIDTENNYLKIVVNNI